MNIDEICKVFTWGIDYGLLIAEQERDSEDMFDAAMCKVYSARFCAPSSIAPRRQAHSQEWRDAKKDAVINFVQFVKEHSGTMEVDANA